MSFGIWELVIILAIVALLFGTKKLRTMGADLGGALKGFRSAMKEDDKDNIAEQADAQVIEGEVEGGNARERADV